MPQKLRDNIGSKTSDALLDKEFWILQFIMLSTPSLRKTKKPQTNNSFPLIDAATCFLYA